ncbi:hypothetical protein AB0K40_43350 [Nonomuraea bangladeshensis]|uniref:Uncharacterized protein n=1 Tax=Nonomuraea bangladeshensis TaxID=404385 RepID=A0ABV3HIK4_9ACTN
MRLTVLRQSTRSLPTPAADVEDFIVDPAETDRTLERIKHYLWHGNSFRALDLLTDLVEDYELLCADSTDDKQRAFLTRLTEFRTYIDRNQHEIPNYGERHRNGEAISSATTEATVNHVISRRMVKKQQMRQTPAAPTSSCRSAPASSTTTSKTTSPAGTPDQTRRSILWPDLALFAGGYQPPLCLGWGAAPCGPLDHQLVSADTQLGDGLLDNRFEGVPFDRRGKRRTGLDQTHRQPQNVGGTGAAVQRIEGEFAIGCLANVGGGGVSTGV